MVVSETTSTEFSEEGCSPRFRGERPSLWSRHYPVLAVAQEGPRKSWANPFCRARGVSRLTPQRPCTTKMLGHLAYRIARRACCQTMARSGDNASCSSTTRPRLLQLVRGRRILRSDVHACCVALRAAAASPMRLIRILLTDVGHCARATKTRAACMHSDDHFDVAGIWRILTTSMS